VSVAFVFGFIPNLDCSYHFGDLPDNPGFGVASDVAVWNHFGADMIDMGLASDGRFNIFRGNFFAASWRRNCIK
jgi:hypothetical protein